jgi:hypothetical protein
MSEQRVETEVEWLATGNPVAMLKYLCDGRVAVRQLRLLAGAWFRLLADRVADDRFRQLAGAVEKHADGLLDASELEAVTGLVAWLSEEWLRGRLALTREDMAGLYCAVFLYEPGQWKAGADIVLYANVAGEPTGGAMGLLLRCLFGNPWRPLPPRTFPVHVLGLARSIYATFPAVSEEYNVLADALEEMGETEAATHCRLELHAKGCHVVDWITEEGPEKPEQVFLS